MDDGEVIWTARASGSVFLEVATDEEGSSVMHSINRTDQRRLCWWLIRRTLHL